MLGAVQALQGTDTTQNSKIAGLQNALKSGGVITSVVAIPGSPGGWNVTVKVNGVSTVYPVHMPPNTACTEGSAVPKQL